MEELVTVPFPDQKVLDIGREDAIMRSAMCFSLEGLAFLHRVTKPCLEEMRAEEPGFVDCMERVAEFVEMTASGTVRVLQPEEKLFKQVAPAHLGAREKTKGKDECAHYIIFQDYYLSDGSETFFCLDESQALLCKLLQELNMKSYYEKCIHGPRIGDDAGILADLLTHLEVFPNIFVVSSRTLTKVKLASTLLRKSVATAKENHIAGKELLRLIAEYENRIVAQLSLQEKIEEQMRAVVNSTMQDCARVADENGRLDSDVLPGLLAGRVLDAKGRFPFIIERVVKRAEVPKPKKGTTPAGPVKYFLPLQRNDRPKDICKYSIVTAPTKPGPGLNATFKLQPKKKTNVLAQGNTISE